MTVEPRLGGAKQKGLIKGDEDGRKGTPKRPKYQTILQLMPARGGVVGGEKGGGMTLGLLVRNEVSVSGIENEPKLMIKSGGSKQQTTGKERKKPEI